MTAILSRVSGMRGWIGVFMTPENIQILFRDWMDVILLIDTENGIIHAANRAVSRQLGYSPEELKGRPVTSLLYHHPLEAALPFPAFIEKACNASAALQPLELIGADTSIHPMEMTASSIICEDAREYLIVGLRDATPRREQMEALAQANERYRHLAETITDYFYSVRVENRFPVETIHSPACEAITGYAPQDFASDPYLWIKMVYEADRDMVRRQAENILQGRELMTIEHRIVRKDGEIRWVSNTPIPSFGPSGRLAGYDGLIKDITSRVQTEAEIRRLTTAIEQSGDAIIITDRNAVIQYVNTAVEQMSGWKREELIGKKTSLFSSGTHNAQFFRGMWETITRGESWNGRITCKRKDGSLHEIQTSITPVRDENGAITNFVSIRREVQPGQ